MKKPSLLLLVITSLLLTAPSHSLRAQHEQATPPLTALDTIATDTIATDTLAPQLPSLTLPQQLTIMVQEKLFETTQVGMEVWDLDADSCLFRHNECWRMRPASTQKVVTAIAALDLLGGNYQFKTALRYSGTIVPPPALSDQSDNSAPSDSSDNSPLPQGEVGGGLLRGSLYLVGGMDPLFSDADIRTFADAVKVLGIDTITGSIYEDRTFRDADKWGEGWCWDDDNPNLSPLLVGGKDEAASRLLSALNAVGITVLGGIGQSAAPAATTLVATRTHDLADVLVPMMKRSDNWYAESLFYQIAHQQGGRGAGVKPARSYIDRLVTRAGADQKLIHVADGSGLSLYNYVTPDMEVQLLRYAAKKPEIIEKLLPSLPVAGVDGTLKSRMKGTKAQGNVQAKTGTVTGVSALAGYCTAANGHRLCFSIINMGIPKAKVGRDFQDRVCALLCR
jgi:D-alanyl-D-alanine carboxypeptidase/D-alanyl-D-alanine-endopeptidase (penicillin-binding protein 4)